MRWLATLRPAFVARLTAIWWQRRPPLLATLLRPLSAVYGAAADRARQRARPVRAPVPVLVVGNLVVGGAGKTPTVIAIVQALQQAGHRPGVLSRGYGREPPPVDQPRAVRPGDDARAVGDEPLLIARRTGAPVWVARRRSAAALSLCRAEPAVDVLVSDDGLQHHALARDAELIVFDDRGIGNGLLLPAGPLREPVPLRLAPHQRVLYTGSVASTPLPGSLAIRRADHAWSLGAWRSGGDRAAGADTTHAPRCGDPGVPLTDLRGRRLLAVAGLAHPQKFHDLLRAAGLQFDTLSLPDHHAYPVLPWPPGSNEIVTTEKDAVKLDPLRLPQLLEPRLRVWVVPLDLQLSARLVEELVDLLFPTG